MTPDEIKAKELIEWLHKPEILNTLSPTTLEASVEQHKINQIEYVTKFIKEIRKAQIEIEFKVKSCDNFFIIREGMEKGKVWLENEENEGGDFNQDEFYMHIRKFFDEKF